MIGMEYFWDTPNTTNVFRILKEGKIVMRELNSEWFSVEDFDFYIQAASCQAINNSLQYMFKIT